MSTAAQPNPLLTLLDLVPSPLLLFSPDGRVAFTNRTAKAMGARPALSLPGDPVVRALVRDIGQGHMAVDRVIEVEVNSDDGVARLRCECAPKPIAGLVAMAVSLVEKPTAAASGPAGEPPAPKTERLTLQQIMELLREELMGAMDGVIAALPQAPEPVLTLRERVERLTDMVNVFGEDVLIGDERMLMPEMVRGTCAELANLARDRAVDFIFEGEKEDLPPVYGSRKLIRRALYECLRNAVDHIRPANATAPRSAVRISFLPTGSHLMLSIRNMGVLTAPVLNRYAGAIFRADQHTEAKGTPTSSTLRIGLPLTQRIMQLHGGRLKIEDVDDEIDVTLELPTGAPLKNTQHLDMLQAQIYAEDLSKLLARSRGRKNPS